MIRVSNSKVNNGPSRSSEEEKKGLLLPTDSNIIIFHARSEQERTFKIQIISNNIFIVFFFAFHNMKSFFLYI